MNSDEWMVTSSVWLRNTAPPLCTVQSPPLGASYCCMNVLLVSANVRPDSVTPTTGCDSAPLTDSMHGTCAATNESRLGSGCSVALGMKYSQPSTLSTHHSIGSSSSSYRLCT